jgi:hypothetical protein
MALSKLKSGGPDVRILSTTHLARLTKIGETE